MNLGCTQQRSSKLDVISFARDFFFGSVSSLLVQRRNEQDCHEFESLMTRFIFQPMADIRIDISGLT